MDTSSPSPAEVAGRPEQRKLVLLHGTLAIEIHEAENLPNLDKFQATFQQCFKISCPFYRPKRGQGSDPYTVVSLGTAQVAHTRSLQDNQSPFWNSSFLVNVAHYCEEVVFHVKDEDVFGAPVIGECRIPIDLLAHGGSSDDWFDLKGPKSPHGKMPRLRLSLSFIPIASSLQRFSARWEDLVHPSYFPLRTRSRVIPYQDAAISPSFDPHVELEGGRMWQPQSCWRDIYRTICGARHTICIAGWSIDETITLLRGEDGVHQYGNPPLGDLLKMKANEGVLVMILAWDDRSSINTPFVTSEGVMGTRDEHVRKIFRGSKVQCKLVKRRTDPKISWFKQRVFGTFFSHHQKAMVADSDIFSSSGNRTLVGFVGGMDLSSGRYDTQDHPLFATLTTDHAQDFVQRNFKTSANDGPREPWHDVHSRVEGPVVWDLLKNFEERWLRAQSKHPRKRRLLRKLHKPPFMTQPGPLDVPDHELWNAQIVRSIDSGSVESFPRRPSKVAQRGLVETHGATLDQSIHDVYVAAIRRAEDFVYIENQYFIGSSHAWTSHEDCGAENLIPIEIALKIASKIRNRERFSAYILIPFWPEGQPKSGKVQAIMFWQTKTMEMMYKIIAEALHDMEMSNDFHPRDYLSFYCLVRRESNPSGTETSAPMGNSDKEKILRSRRQMIYVHAKTMVVDDEFLVIGSANINQRSMDGKRDTEIAVAGYQPHYVRQEKTAPSRQGDVYGFRMSLWAEHLGVNTPVFQDPKSVECMRTVNNMAQTVWQQYLQKEPCRLSGHLIPYAVAVSKEGNIEQLPDCPEFPDLGGSTLGKPSPALPPVLTT